MSAPRLSRPIYQVLIVLAVISVFLSLSAAPCLAGNNPGVTLKNGDLSKGGKSGGEGLLSQGRASKGAAGPVWYLAEGSTNWGFDTYLHIENPNDIPVATRVTFQTTSGPKTMPTITLAAESQYEINARNFLGGSDFSTMVECLDGYVIAVDRNMIWNEGTAAHSSIGVTAPATQWYLAEGSTGGSFETWVLVQNPVTTAAGVDLTFNTALGPVAGPHLNIAPGTRQTVDVSKFVPNNWNVSTMVTSDSPVIAERAMYWDDRVEGHDSIGTTVGSTQWFLAEGSTGGSFETWVLVQNPGNDVAVVDITYMTDTGAYDGGSLSLNPKTRATIYVNEAVPNTYNVSTFVSSDRPVIAERAMYGNNRMWGHDSIGMEAPHDIIMLPSGTGQSPWETWTLVQNPNGRPVQIKVFYYSAAGKGAYTFEDTLAAYSRKSYNMADAGDRPDLGAILVFCETSGAKVNAERAQYILYKGVRIAGTDTIGGYLDVE
jgi:Family of unknown function (DUF5719)